MGRGRGGTGVINLVFMFLLPPLRPWKRELPSAHPALPRVATSKGSNEVQREFLVTQQTQPARDARFNHHHLPPPPRQPPPPLRGPRRRSSPADSPSRRRNLSRVLLRFFLPWFLSLLTSSSLRSLVRQVINKKKKKSSRGTTEIFIALTSAGASQRLSYASQSRRSSLPFGTSA